MDTNMFFWFLVATSSDIAYKKSGDVQEDCQKLYTIDSEVLMMLNKTGSLTDENDKEPKCFVQCLLERASLMDDDGALDLNEAKTVLQEYGTGADEAVASCAASVQGDMSDTTVSGSNLDHYEHDEGDKCERAYRYVKCIMLTSNKKSSTEGMMMESSTEMKKSES